MKAVILFVYKPLLFLVMLGVLIVAFVPTLCLLLLALGLLNAPAAGVRLTA